MEHMGTLPARSRVDFLVLGSGVAGLTFALEAAGRGSVLVVSKRQRQEGSTQYAQGGIASVLGPDDDPSLHIQDTLVAGAGLCKQEAVEVTVREGPDRIRWLQSIGVEFDFDGGRLHLTREGGHSRRRVAHVKDHTGREVEQALLAACDARGVQVVDDQVAVDLITTGKLGLGGPNQVLGAYLLDRASGEVVTVTARAVILATGGAGKVYLYTSNPDVSTGDGVAMAYRAGAAVANLEFFQFHPTCLYHPQAKSFLISEALRGEGGKLRLRSGATFMQRRRQLMREVLGLFPEGEEIGTGAQFTHSHVQRGIEFMKRYFAERKLPAEILAEPGAAISDFCFSTRSVRPPRSKSASASSFV